jgi:hypothetical protein
MAFMRTQPDGEEAVSTLLVVDVVVGDDVPQDPPDPGDSTDASHDHH